MSPLECQPRSGATLSLPIFHILGRMQPSNAPNPPDADHEKALQPATLGAERHVRALLGCFDADELLEAARNNAPPRRAASMCPRPKQKQESGTPRGVVRCPPRPAMMLLLVGFRGPQDTHFSVTVCNRHVSPPHLWISELPHM